MNSRDRELKRAREEYDRRDADSTYERMWSPLNPSVSMIIQSRERAIARVLRGAGMLPRELRMADIGCGAGAEIARFLLLGFQPGNCSGIDLSEGRIERARDLLPSKVELVVGSADSTPWEEGSFDVVTQFTLMSSVLDGDIRAAIAAEMQRVCAPGGIIIWYDMRRDYPRGRKRWPKVQSEGKLHWFTDREVRELFPACNITIESVTLDGTVGDRFAARSILAYELLDGVSALHSHHLAVIRKPSATREKPGAR